MIRLALGMVALGALLSAPDTRPPSAPLVFGPRTTANPEPVYRFVSRDDKTPAAQIRFRCSFDRAKLHPCPARYVERLTVGKHLLRLRALDRAGNASRITRVDVVVTPPPLPSAGRVVSSVRLPRAPGPMAFGEGSLWVGAGDDAVYRIDPATNRVIARIPTRSGRYSPSVAVGLGSVWVSNFDEDSVWRIDPATNGVVAKIAVGFSPEGIGFARGFVWVANHHGDEAQPPLFWISQVDPATNREIARVSVPGQAVAFGGRCCGPQALTAAAGAVWTGSPRLRAVIRIDPATKAVSTIDLPQACGGLAGDEEAVWAAAGCGVDMVARIDPRANRVAALIETGAEAADVEVGFGAVWVRTRDSVLRLDPATNRITARLATPGPGGMAIGDGSIWVGDEFSDTILRIEPAL